MTIKNATKKNKKQFSSITILSLTLLFAMILTVLDAQNKDSSLISFTDEESPNNSNNSNDINDKINGNDDSVLSSSTATFTRSELDYFGSNNDRDDDDNSSRTTTGRSRKQKQREILAKIKGNANMLNDKHPSMAYARFDENEHTKNIEQKCSTTSERNSNNAEFIVDAFKNSEKNLIGYSHMAMISELPKGAFYRWILIWQCSRGIEGTSDMHLRATFSDDLRKWTESIVINVKKDKRNAVWAPVLHLDRKENILWLFFAESVKCLRMMTPENRWSPGGNIMSVSTIDGISWTKPKTLMTTDAESGNPKVIANKLIVHPKTKNWVLPYWGEASSAKGCRSGHPTISGVLISKDRGHTWHSHGKVHPRHGRVIEGTVAVLSSADDSILQLWRSKSGFLMQSISQNGGLSWTVPKRRTDLKNPDSKASMVDFSVQYTDDDDGAGNNNIDSSSNSSSGKIRGTTQRVLSNSELAEMNSLSSKHYVALAFNDASSGRKKLSLSISNKGDGKEFTKVKEIESGRTGVHYHYPTVEVDPYYYNDCSSSLKSGSERQKRIRVIVAYSYMKRISSWANVLKESKFGGIKVATVLI
jgi:hypothetical protein